MSTFWCPRCEMFRHVRDMAERDSDDPSGDCCWYCGTKVPYTEGELKRMREDADS